MRKETGEGRRMECAVRSAQEKNPKSNKLFHIREKVFSFSCQLCIRSAPPRKLTRHSLFPPPVESLWCIGTHFPANCALRTVHCELCTANFFLFFIPILRFPWQNPPRCGSRPGSLWRISILVNRGQTGGPGCACAKEPWPRCRRRC